LAAPIAVLVLLQLADEFGAVGTQAGKDVLGIFCREHDATMPGAFGSEPRDRRHNTGIVRLLDRHVLKPGDPDGSNFACTVRSPRLDRDWPNQTFEMMLACPATLPSCAESTTSAARRSLWRGCERL
jgi:hypothetical protein